MVDNTCGKRLASGEGYGPRAVEAEAHRDHGEAS